LASVTGLPGGAVHARLVAMLIDRCKSGAISPETLLQWASAPFESVRYFEFDRTYEALRREAPPRRWIDVSSPRLLPLLLSELFPDAEGVVINPDVQDLRQTAALLEPRPGLYLRSQIFDAIDDGAESFDLCTSLSVIEHIPTPGDARAVQKMWSLLRPGGLLLLTVPCARRAFEEFIDRDEYGLLPADADGFVFGQRFYDAETLHDRLFGTLAVEHVAFFGERRAGAFFGDRLMKLSGADRRPWTEPLRTRLQYRRFCGTDEMPGIGVCFVAARKPF
jgi:SAM-dependent methyltransferase